MNSIDLPETKLSGAIDGPFYGSDSWRRQTPRRRLGVWPQPPPPQDSVPLNATAVAYYGSDSWEAAARLKRR